MHRSIDKLSPLFFVLFLFYFINPVAAFGAGEVAEGSGLANFAWLHGDIAQVLLQLPVSFIDGQNYAFTDLQRMQVYLGNWLRDYSQLIDIVSLQKVPEPLLRAIVSFLAFNKFSLATGEFDIKADRLGCYRPEEHIDNPRGYALDENGKYRGDSAMNALSKLLRHEVTDAELAVDPSTGMKNYIANEHGGFVSSAGHVRGQLRLCIMQGRLGRRGDEAAFLEALRYLGSAVHTIEDFSAHSNFVELALTKSGVPNVFPCVGDACRITIPGTDSKVPPLVTGTFGSLDLIASLIGIGDDLVASRNKGYLGELLSKFGVSKQSNVDDLYRTLKGGILTLSKVAGLEELTQKLESVFNIAKNAQANSGQYDPSSTEPDILKRNLQNLANGPGAIWNVIEPAFALHDQFMRWFIENKDLLRVPLISDAVDAVQKAISDLTYTILAIVVEPSLLIVRSAIEEAKVKVEAADRDLSTHVVLYAADSQGSDPSHSVLAKDHFSNVLNAPAGLVGTAITNWTIQQVVRCWDDPQLDIDSTIDTILKIFHHPHFADGKSFIQQTMFAITKQWWDALPADEQKNMASCLSKDGVRSNLNNPKDFKPTSKGPAVFDGSTPSLKTRPDRSLTEEASKLIAEAGNKVLKDIENIKNGVMTELEQELERLKHILPPVISIPIPVPPIFPPITIPPIKFPWDHLFGSSWLVMDQLTSVSTAVPLVKETDLHSHDL